MIVPFAISLTLLGLSGLLIDQHRRARWRAEREHNDQRRSAQSDDRSRARSFAFACWQYRRRMVGSSTIGVVGALFALLPIIPREPLPMTAYVAALVFGCLVIFLCGVLDAVAGARFYRRAKLEDRLQQAALAVEIERRERLGSTTADDA